MNGNWYGLDQQYEIARAHHRDLVEAAARARLVRQVRQPSPWRRALGSLLISAGEALAGRRPAPAREPLAPPPLPAAPDDLSSLHVVWERDPAA